VNLPILLSLLRLALTVPVGASVIAGEWGTALALAVAAGVSDAADGWVARRWNLATRAGAWLDPIADKTLLATVYLCLGIAGVIPVWLVALVFARDALILGMAAVALARTPFRDFPPSLWGKLSTVFQIVTAGTAIGSRVWDWAWVDDLLVALICSTGAVTIVSGAHYLWSGRRRWVRWRAGGGL
jgi:cardiolipin synthase